MTRIFISHSHFDEAIAFKLVTFLLATLRIEEEEILCTSNPDQGLSYSSSSITDQLKIKLKKSEALIILITTDSLDSAWIPFEVGSFWTTDKHIIPILGPSLSRDDLPGPLRSLLSIPIEAQDFEAKLNNAVKQLADKLEIKQKDTLRRNHTLGEFSQHLRVWESQLPNSNLSQQQKIELQQQRISELTKELEEIKTAFQQEKQQIEQFYQTQIQELKQSYQSQLQVEKFPQPLIKLHVIWICDCSGSMSIDGKIQALNNAIKEALPEFRRVAEENHAQILIRAIKFSDKAQWHIAQPTPIEDFYWQDLEVGGSRSVMGESLSLLSEQLKSPPLPERMLPPLLVLVTDGSPTDDFENGLAALINQPWGKKAVRIAIAIGRDADKNALQKFMDHSQLEPLESNNIKSLVRYIKWTPTEV